MKLRVLAATVALSLVGAFGGAGLAAMDAASAHAAKPAGPSLTTTQPCTTTVAGVSTPDTCTLTVTGFNVVNGVLTATGTVTNSTGTTIPFAAAPVQASGTCPILDLTLGPLHLDLLGVVIDLNQVHLTITAQQAPGNLLGNLLCSVAHLLDNPASPTTGLAALLNRILGAL